MSEIDAIFGANAQAGPSKLAKGISSTSPTQKKRKRKDAKQPQGSSSTLDHKQDANSTSDIPSLEAASVKKARRPVPTTVLDPSALIEGEVSKGKKTKTKPKASSRTSTEQAKIGKPKASSQSEKELDSFTDSRGTDRNRTEEGFAIYSENELKIGRGGDTPLCPFDCDCCF